jgi:hypothetical protein
MLASAAIGDFGFNDKIGRPGTDGCRADPVSDSEYKLVIVQFFENDCNIKLALMLMIQR